MEESKVRANYRIPKPANGQKGIAMDGSRVSRVTKDRTGMFERKSRLESRAVRGLKGGVEQIEALTCQCSSG